MYSSIEALPNSLTPNEKLQLATYSIETTDASLAPQFNINKHIIGFAQLIHPDEPLEQAKIKGMIKEIILTHKSTSKSFTELGNESLQLLDTIESTLPYELSTLLNYHEQLQIESVSAKEKSQTETLELIKQINNNVFRMKEPKL